MAIGSVRGRLITSESRIPRSMLSSAHRYSRSAEMLSRESVHYWNVSNDKLLKTFGLRIIGIEKMQLKPGTSPANKIEALLSQRISLAAALPALAVALKGRGDLLDVDEAKRGNLKTAFKELADLRASATEMEVFYSLVEENSGIAFLVRVGEGGGEAGRRKPGEALNASLYPGQLITGKQYVGLSVEALEKRGVNVLRIATDPIDGTTKTVMGEQGALTSMLVTEGEISSVPDVYMEKLTLDAISARKGLSLQEPLDKLVQGLSDTHRVPVTDLNGFALKRDRHPIEQLLGLGINMVLDSDGDLLPGFVPGAQPGVYDNGKPLHAMIGDAGGAAEYLIAAAANQWLGGEAHGRFVSGDGMKNRGWEGRYDFTEQDRQVIEGAGFRLNHNYPIDDLVDLSDGVAAFGGITSNSHFPHLSGVYLGNNYAQVDIIKVGASGRLAKRRFTFEFLHPLELMVERFSPMSEALMRCDIKDVRGEVRKILADPSRSERLQREIGLSLYQVFNIKDGKFEVDDLKLRELGDDRTEAIIQSLKDLMPDWFV